VLGKIEVIDTPYIVPTDIQKTAVIHIVVSRSEIQSVMEIGISELLSTLAEQGVKIIGSLFSYHLRIDPDIFDFEIGVPVEKTIEPIGRVKPSELPSTTVVRTIYRGAYEDLGQAWGEFKSWINSNNYVQMPNMWEVYLSGPETSQNPKDWCTELNQVINI
jgi:effector-binding domain-containing protein